MLSCDSIQQKPDGGWHLLFGFFLRFFFFFFFSASAAFHRYGRDAKVVHFLGKVKPWHLAYNAQRGEVKGHAATSDVYQLHPDYLLMWWQLYSKDVLPLLQRAYGDTPFNSGFVDESEEVSGDPARRAFKRCTFSGPHQRLLSSVVCSSEGRTPSALGLTITGKRLICSTFSRTRLQPKMSVAAGVSRRLPRAVTAKESVASTSASNS